MEKVKKAKEAGKKGKARFEAKLEEIQNSKWAGPIATCLTTAATLVTLVPPPAGTILQAALSLGATVLSPDPDLAADLRIAKEEIKDEMKVVFKEVVQYMAEIRDDLSALRSDMKDVLKLIYHREFYEGIDTIDAYHSVFMEGLDNLERTNESFQNVEVTFRASFKKHFQVEKIFNFLKIRVS